MARLGAALAVALTFAAVSPPGLSPGGAVGVAHAENGDEQTLRVAVTQSIDSLNPFQGFFASSTEIFGLIYDQLTLYSPKDYSTLPGLATEWETSDDKLTWTYTIRKDAKWSDGKPLTARDIAFTFNLMMRDEAAAEANGNFVEGFSSVTAPDDTTLVIVTEEPSATMLALDVPIVPEHVWSKVTDIAGFKNDTFPIVGSGPFILTDYKVDQFVTLEANKDYWGEKPKVDRLVFRYFKNADAAVQALRQGEVDIVGGRDVTPAHFKALQGQEGVAASQARGTRFVEITFNPGAATRDNKPIGTGHPALKDVRVRQAMHHAIDNKTLVDKVLAGYGEAAGGYIPAAFSLFHWKPDGDTEVKFDLAEANRILDEAGYKKGTDGVRTMPDGKRPLKIRLYAHSDRPLYATMAEFIKGWFADIGIQLDVQAMDSTKLNDLLGKADFDAAFSSWGVNPDPDFILSIQTCGNRPDAKGEGGNTDTFYCNPRYDELYDEQGKELDRDKRAEIVREMQKILYTEAPVITLYYADVLQGYRSDRFTDIQKQPADDGVILQQQGYWGYVSATPVSEAAKAEDDSQTVAYVVGAVVVLLLIALAVVLLRRRATAAERE